MCVGAKGEAEMHAAFGEFESLRNGAHWRQVGRLMAQSSWDPEKVLGIQKKTSDVRKLKKLRDCWS